MVRRFDAPAGRNIAADNNRGAVPQARRGVDFCSPRFGAAISLEAGRGFWTVNVDGTQVASREVASGNVRDVCHMSSTAIFRWTDAAPPMPLDEYGRSKLAGEHPAQRTGASASCEPRAIVGPRRSGIFDTLFDRSATTRPSLSSASRSVRRTLFVPGIVADAPRLANGACQRLHAYNQGPHVPAEMNLTIASSLTRLCPLVQLREGMCRSVEYRSAQNVDI